MVAVTDSIIASTRIGRTQSMTPEGYLLCEGVPVARTGEMVYAPGEIMGLDAGPDGVVRVTRDEADVFDATAMASFNRKPITDNHPSEGVTSKTWRQHAVGVVLNPRRGDGADANLLLGHRLIMAHPDAG